MCRIGKSRKYGVPVAGLIDCGPVVPEHPPTRLAETTKKRSVSTGLPGPIRLSHQPRRFAPTCKPAAWASPVSAWHTTTTLSRAADSSP